MDAIEQSITDFIASEILHSSASKALAPDRLLLEEGILDSLGLQQLVMFLKKEFSLDIDDDELLPEHFETVHAIAELVARIRG
jgi:acyl carrier protein